ncbi:hypothetical protein [Naasia sp. SYSU D00948]|uniref:hypothetical protein n=1 Tax=Naasia sp. SYSU D00948 TaxID=2817379 RepID=UPI001B30872C|nr:hypothetical protein [Naasia sp. SYSU D00948]
MSRPDAAARRPFPWVRTVVLYSIVGSLVAAAVVGVVSALVGEFGTLSWQAMGTIALFVFFALLSWYDADVSARRSRWFGVASVLTSIYLLIVGLAKIWLPHDDDLVADGDGVALYPTYSDGFSDFLSWLWLVLVARIALLHIHLLLTIYARFQTAAMRVVSRVTFVLVAVLAVMLSLPALTPGQAYPELYWRVVAAVAIADALGTILVPLVHVLFHRQPRPAAPASPQHAPGQPVAMAGTPAQVPDQSPAPAPGGPLPLTLTSERPNPLAPPLSAYAPLEPKPAPQLLMWPRYSDGRPLPARADGKPDFTGVLGYE